MQHESTTIHKHRGRRLARVARVSTLDQEQEGTSLEDQRAKGALYAQLHDLTLVNDDAYSGDESGALPLAQRPILQSLLADARARRFDAVVWHKIDRIARSARAILEVWATLEDLGITIYVIEPPIDSSDPFGRLMRTILAAFAEFERDMIVGRTSAALVRKAQRGETYLNCPKYGYTYLSRHADGEGAGQVRIDAAQARTVERIFGRAGRGATPGRIARELTAEGVPSPAGLSHWSERTVQRILDDEAYRGARIWGQRKTCLSRNGKRTTRPADPSGAPITLTYPPLITDAAWERAHAPAARADVTVQRAPRGRYLLAGGLVRCAEHDKALVGSAPDPARRQYRCHRPDGRGGRAVHTIPADALEEAVWSAVLDFMLDPARGLAAARRLAQEAEVSLVEVAAQRAEVAAQRAEVARQRKWVLSEGRAAGASASEIREQMSELAQLDSELGAEENRLRAQEALAREDLPQAEQIAGICRRLHERAATMTREERCDLLEDLEVRGELVGARVHITGKVGGLERWVDLPGTEPSRALAHVQRVPAAFALEVELGLAS